MSGKQSSGHIHAQRPLADLRLSTRARRVCDKLGLHTVEDLRGRSDAELLAVRGCGDRTCAELRRASRETVAGVRQQTSPSRSVDLFPERITELSLAQLGLSPEVLVQLEGLGIFTLGQALAHSVDVWQVEPGCELAAAIRSGLDHLFAPGLECTGEAVEDTSPTDTLLQALPVEFRNHLRRRLGLGVPMGTGEELPSSRPHDVPEVLETERQLRTVLNERASVLLSRLRDEVLTELGATKGVVTADQMGAATLAHAMARETGSPLLPLRLVAFCFPDDFHLHKGFLVPLPFATFGRLVERVRELTEPERLPVPLAELRTGLNDIVNPVPTGLLRHVIQNVRRLTVRGDESGEIVTRRADSVASRMYDILRELGKPTQLLDLMFHYRDRHSRAHKVRLLTNLRRDKTFLEVGKDLWSLRESHEEELEMAFTEADRAALVINSLGGRHHVRSLLAEGSSERALYLVIDCLRRDRRVRHLGRGEFCPASSSRSAVLQGLARDFRRAMGEMPLARFVANSPADKRRLVASLLYQNRMFVEPSPDRVDLITNYPVNAERLKRMLDTVSEGLHRRGGYAPAAELLPDLQEEGVGGAWLSAHMLIDVLRRNGDFELLPGGIVALRSMGLGGWITSRARAAIRSATEPITADEIALEVPELADFAEALEQILERDPLVQTADGTRFCLI